MSYYEPDDDGGVFEAAYDAGFWSPDEIDELRDLLKHWEFPDPFPRPDSRNDAIMILLNAKLHPQMPQPEFEDPHVTWAKKLLQDVVG